MTRDWNLRSKGAVGRLFVAALISASALAMTAGLANAQTPAGPEQCAANPWIRSGYCEAHQAWSAYYCQCEFEPSYSNGGGDDSDLRPRVPRGDLDDDSGDEDDTGDADNTGDDTGPI